MEPFWLFFCCFCLILVFCLVVVVNWLPLISCCWFVVVDFLFLFLLLLVVSCCSCSCFCVCCTNYSCCCCCSPNTCFSFWLFASVLLLVCVLCDLRYPQNANFAAISEVFPLFSPKSPFFIILIFDLFFLCPSSPYSCSVCSYSSCFYCSCSSSSSSSSSLPVLRFQTVIIASGCRKNEIFDENGGTESNSLKSKKGTKNNTPAYRYRYIYPSLSLSVSLCLSLSISLSICLYLSVSLSFSPHLSWCPSISVMLPLTPSLFLIAHSIYSRASLFGLVYIHIYIHACNLIWRAVLGFQDVMKQQETRRNKERKTKKLRKKKPQTQQKPPRFCGGFCWPVLTIKLGIL